MSAGGWWVPSPPDPQVSVACRDILPGEELSDCYGLPWYSVPRERRQHVQTKFYKFSCACPACQGHWPVTDLLGLTAPQGDTAREQLEEVVAAVAAATEALTIRLEWEEGLQLLRVAAALVVERVPPPALEYLHCPMAVWRALWLLVGNKRLAKLF